MVVNFIVLLPANVGKVGLHSVRVLSQSVLRGKGENHSRCPIRMFRNCSHMKSKVVYLLNNSISTSFYLSSCDKFEKEGNYISNNSATTANNDNNNNNNNINSDNNGKRYH